MKRIPCFQNYLEIAEFQIGYEAVLYKSYTFLCE